MYKSVTLVFFIMNHNKGIIIAFMICDLNVNACQHNSGMLLAFHYDKSNTIVFARTPIIVEVQLWHVPISQHKQSVPSHF